MPLGDVDDGAAVRPRGRGGEGRVGGHGVEHPGAGGHRTVEQVGEFGVAGEVVEVVLAEQVVEGGLAGAHGVVEGAEGAVERPAVHQGEWPHRGRGVLAEQGADLGEADALPSAVTTPSIAR